MKSINLFRGEDGREFEVPEDEQENFQQEMQDIPVSRMEKYRGEDGREFDVPEQERDAFMQEMQGLKIDRIRTVKAGGDVWDVPESEAQGFAEFYRNDPRFDTEREEKAKTIASELDAPDSPLWAGIKTFFSPKNYAENATLEGVSATSANVLRGVAQAPVTIADKLAAVEQFGSRVRELPGFKSAMLMTPYGVMGLAGEGVEAILSLNGKDGGKQYRDLIQKARDYVDGKREEFLGYRNEKGQKATADDFAVTIGGQAVNSVAESYLLTAPKIMQGINGMMQAGGKGLLARMTPTLQTMLYGASTAEGTAGKAEAKGMSNEKAVGMGLLTGTIESALESVSQVTGLQDAMSKNALKEAVARTVWKKAGEVLKDATGEGLTEFGQQAQQGTIEKLSKIDEKSWGQIGMESASAAALGFIAGGSSASAKGIFDSPRQGAALPGDALPNLEVSDEQVRMEQEAQAAGEGERAQRESVLEGEEAQGEAGEGAQPAAMDQPGQDTGGGVRVGDPALAGENRLGFEGGTAVPEPLQIADGVFVEPMEEVAPRQGEKPLPGQSTPLALPQVKIRLASGKQIYSNDPGLAALVEYWYKDRVLFPPAPAGDTGRQAGPKQITDGATRQDEADPALNASRRAGFQVKPAKRVLINIGRSKDSYRGTIVQILDGQTVRVKIDKTQRSLKNSRAGYADVDVRQLSQFANVVGKQNYLDLMKGMTEEQKKKVEADAKAFKDELIDVGLFLDQDAWKYVDGVKGSKARTTKDDLIKDAYARASDMMGIPLDNHIQRAQALPILQEFHTRMQGSEGLPYDAYAERAARDSEQEMADRRASGEFSLADLTPEEMAQADAKLQAQKDAQAQRAEVMRRAAAPIVGTTGDMTDIIPGMEDFTFDDTPLFGFKGGQEEDIGSVPVEDNGEELPFNMAPEYNVAPEAAGVYNQETSGGADTPRAQEQAAQKTPINTPPWMQERNAVGMDLMDAVGMVYQLTGKFPRVMENLRKTRALGYFDPNTKEIVLWAKIFGLVDDQDRARITKALKAKGFEGEKLYAQEAIEVKALMEKRRKEHQKRPLKVAVHELAHLVDFLPHETMNRGNILGHVAALKKFMKHAIGPEPGAPGPMTAKETEDLRKRAEKEMRDLLGEARTVIEEVIREVPEYKVLGISSDDVKGLLGMDSRTATPELYDWFSRQDSLTKREVLKAAMKGVVDERMAEFARREQVGTRIVKEQVSRDIPGYTKAAGKKRFTELLREETERRRIVELKRIKEEARAIIPWWRGVDKMEAYFEKPEEMYAELMGIFLADPSELERRAPTVYRAFMGWMVARPEVEQAYVAFLDSRNMPQDKQAAMKLSALKRGMTKEDEAARREADEMARQPGKWASVDSFLYTFHRRSAPITRAADRSLKTLLQGAKTDAERKQLQDIYEGVLVGVKRQSTMSRVIQAYDKEVNEKVATPLDRLGLDMLDLGVYQALRRVAYELDGKAAPAGVEPASALKLLSAISEQYGQEKWDAFQKIAKEFRRIRQERILNSPDLRAMFDKELLEKLDSNVEYVTFKHVPTMEQIQEFKQAIRKAKSGDKLLREDVAEFLTGELENRLGSSVGAKIHKYVGSFGPIANPIVATLSKDDQLLRSSVRNTLRRQVYELVKESGLDLIRDVKYERSGKGALVPKMVDDRNWKTVVYMQDGQVKGFLADRWLAKALETGTIDNVEAFRRVMMLNTAVTRTYTQLKYSFSFFNNMKDVERASNLVPGMQRMRPLGININFIPGGAMIATLQRYGVVSDPLKAILPPFMFNDKMVEWNLASARRAAILIQSGSITAAEERARQLLQEGKTHEAEKLMDDVWLAREGLEKPILMSHIEAINEDSKLDDYGRRLYKSGVTQQDLSNGLKMVAKIRSFFPELARKIERIGETGELTTKLATWKYLDTHKKNLSEAQRILITRELGGSPDFSERGSAASYVEFVTSPFVNAAKEGTLGYAKAFKDRPGETTQKLLMNVVAPTMVRHILASGLGLALLKIAWPDDEERESSWIYNFMNWYYNAARKVPSYILKNYNSFPVPMAKEDSKFWTLMLRMPMDQTSQLASLITWNTMDSMGETLLDSLGDGRTPTVLSRTERPWLEAGQSLVGSVLPGEMAQAPVLGLLGLVKGFVFGTNFYDSFKERDVFNEDELIARWSTPNAAETLSGEMFNRMGGAMVKRYTPDNIWGEEPPSLHKWLNMPFIQPTIGGFLNVYTGGQAQMERKMKRIEKEFEAPIKVEVKNDFARAIREGSDGQLNISQDIREKWRPQDSSYKENIRSQIYLEEWQRLQGEYFNRKVIKGDISELMKASKEDNPMMRDIRMDIMEMRR